MKYSKLFLWLQLALPWLSLPLLGKKTLKRFLPAAIFIALLVHYEGKLAKKRKWWLYYQSIHPKVPGGFTLTWGTFLIGSMWILKFTYGRFWVYTLVNLIVDSGFTYILTEPLKKVGIVSLVRMKKYQLSMLFFFKSLLLYGFQSMKEKITD